MISLYLVGHAFIPEGQTTGFTVWMVVCLVGVVVVRVYGTTDPQKNLPPDWVHVGISAVAFLIWVYSLGGPFVAWNLYVPYIGSLLVLAWTFFVPFFYQGPANG